MGPADRCKCAEESFSQNIHRLSAKILTLTCFDNQRLKNNNWLVAAAPEGADDLERSVHPMARLARSRTS